MKVKIALVALISLWSFAKDVACYYMVHPSFQQAHQRVSPARTFELKDALFSGEKARQIMSCVVSERWF